jgi:scyllo-inositol 2-dehydrogenase (NADP+)
MAQRISVGVLGFGLAGGTFHCPLIRAEPRLELKAIATSRREVASRAFPGVAIHASSDSLIAEPSIDLVVVATPDGTHAGLARAALLAGKHVVVDKPLTTNSIDAAALLALAQQRKRVLTVFHNRRWDGDFKTVAGIVKSGQLGEIKLATLSWDRFRPAVNLGWREQSIDPWGALLNLGPHLMDQALLLFGRPESITADLATQRQGARSPDYFAITLHYGALRVLLSVSILVADARPRFSLHGTRGSFVKYGIDPQEDNLRLGIEAGAAGCGADPESLYGVLTVIDAPAQRIRTLDGDWRPFYAHLAAAIADGAAPPVDPADAVHGLELLEIARRSAVEGRTLSVGTQLPVSQSTNSDYNAAKPA